MAAQEMEDTFLRTMATRSTPQLLALLRERHEYVPDAVTAAMTELKRREVSGFEVSDAWDDGQMQAKTQSILANEPLSKVWIVFWLLLPFLALTPLGAWQFRKFEEAGFHRRTLQFVEAVTIGFTGYVILLMLFCL